MDLGELWRERRWRLLWTILMQLPAASNTKAALAQNEEFAAMVLNGRTTDDLRTPGQPSVTLAEFTPEVAALYDVIDRLGDVVSGLVGLGGKKPRPPKRVPRPKSAIERMALENRRQAHKALATRVLPGAQPPPRALEAVN